MDIADNQILPVEQQMQFTPLTLDSGAIDAFLGNYTLFSHHADEIIAFYQNRNYRFGWFDSSGLTEPATN
ncbi:MAG: hypothetical protein ACK4IY_08525, partial [Chitinophagales bacterium]